MTKSKTTFINDILDETEAIELFDTEEIESDAPADDDEEPTFSAKDLARELNIDAKSFRRWLRAHTADRANKGGRWVFTADSKAAFLDLYRNGDKVEPTE